MNTQDANNCINALNDIKTSLTAQLRDLTRCIKEIEEEKERFKEENDPGAINYYNKRIDLINRFLDLEEETKKKSLQYFTDLSDELLYHSKDHNGEE